jgi:hypothetical protein
MSLLRSALSDRRRQLQCCTAFLLCLTGAVLPAQSPPSIAGTWRVVAFEIHDTDGTVIKEFGEKPLGYFIYDATGHVAIQMMENPAKNDPPKAFAYFGTYRVDAAKGIVIHHVEGAVEGVGGAGPKVRDYIGKDELRPFRLEGDHLFIEIKKGNSLGLPADEGVEFKVREMVRVR